MLQSLSSLILSWFYFILTDLVVVLSDPPVSPPPGESGWRDGARGGAGQPVVSTTGQGLLHSTDRHCLRANYNINHQSSIINHEVLYSRIVDSPPDTFLDSFPSILLDLLRLCYFYLFVIFGNKSLRVMNKK